MAKVMTDESNYAAIADAIRSKLGASTRYKPSEMAAAIESIVGCSDAVIPAYQGLSYGYIYVGGLFSGGNTKSNYVNLYDVSANHTYAFFVGNVVSNRLRIAFFSEKGISDFIQYIQEPSGNENIFSGQYITDKTDYDGNRLKERVIFTPDSNGIVFVTTSSDSTQAPSFCFKLS